MEIQLEWDNQIPVYNLRSLVLKTLNQHGEPLRWAITYVSATEPEQLSRQIRVEAVVVPHE